jgi:hypothetical protein
MYILTRGQAYLESWDLLKCENELVIRYIRQLS